jgi:flagellar motor switch protein FliG
MKQIFFASMTERAAKLMREEMTAMGPVRSRDCEEAQTALVRLAKSLAERGEIMLVDPKSDDGLIY